MIGLNERGSSVRNAKFDKAAFEFWVKYGSLAVAGHELRKAGYLRTDGKPYSFGGIRHCALRHYVKNYPETRDHIEESYRSRGFSLGVESLDLSTINYVFQILTRTSETIEWLKKFGFYALYSEHINLKLEARVKRKHAKKPVEQS